MLEYQNTVKQTRYYSGSYEKTVTATGTQEVHYISCGNGVNIAYVIEGSTGSYHYLHSDYLGSILAVSDASGNLEYEQNFDAWGRDRNPADWTYTASTNPRPSWLYRGYTGHEHLREFTLINMNARMYDTETGRMLAVDNYVLDAHNSQDYNRYSYARNNPLKYADPSGESVIVAVAIGAVVGAYIGGSSANGTFNPGKWDYSSSSTWVGMGTGALIGGLSGGLAGAGQLAFAGGVTVAGVTVGQVALTPTSSSYDLSVSSGGHSTNLASWDKKNTEGYELNSLRSTRGFKISPGIPVQLPFMSSSAFYQNFLSNTSILRKWQPEYNPDHDPNYGFPASILGAAGQIGKDLFYTKMKSRQMWYSYEQNRIYRNYNGNGTASLGNAKAISKGFNYLGKGAGMYSAYSATQSLADGDINVVQWGAEIGSTGFSTYGGLYGAAWGIGWEGGRTITKQPFYQDFKQNTWLPYRRKNWGY